MAIKVKIMKDGYKEKVMRIFIYGTLSVFVFLACFCLAEVPEPAIVQGPGEWTVETRFTHPQQILLEGALPDSKPRRFWYVILTVTNKTRRDVDFFAKCELMTDTFQIIRSGEDMPSVVFENIKRRHQDSYPFLELLQKTSNKLLEGEDNAKDLAIIWPDFDAKAKNIKIFITGLSNETAVVYHPIEKDELGQPKRVFLRKTLELDYDLGGDPAFRSDVKLIYNGKRWIMR